MPRSSISDDIKMIGCRLREARQRQKMCQTELGEHLSVTFQQIQKYENGKNRISAAKLALAATLLNVSVTYLMFGSEQDRGDTVGLDDPDAMAAKRIVAGMKNPMAKRAAIQALLGIKRAFEADDQEAPVSLSSRRAA